jgi:hypothetical protein
MKSTALNTWGWLLLLYSKTILAQEPALSSSSLQAQIKLEKYISSQFLGSASHTYIQSVL